MHFQRILYFVAAIQISVITVVAQPNTDIYLARIEASGHSFRLVDPMNITARPGYDNQPQFLADSSGIMFTSERGGQTDIFRYDLSDRTTNRLTSTPESEYSPTPTRDGKAFSVVRVEADSTQRLWQFSFAEEAPFVILPDVAPVGYHAWGFTNTLLLFVLGDPPTLQLADSKTGESQIVSRDIGRSVQKIPVQRAVSFLKRLEDGWSIERYDVPTGTISPLTPPLEGSQDHTWMQDGTHILMAKDAVIYAWEPAGRAWKEVADFSEDGITGITRMATSPDGTWVAFVAAD